MKDIFNKIFQVLFDTGIGLAVYFILGEYMSNVNSNTIVVIAFVITAIFAETVEFHFRK